MSDNVIDLLSEDEEVKPQVIYSPKILSGIMVAYTSNTVGRTYHHALEFNRYLSSIWQSHPDGYRYINVKDIEIKQRVSDDMILICKVTIDAVYMDGEFIINKAEVTGFDFEHPDLHVHATYDNPSEIVIESLTVDNQHVLATGNVPAAPKIPSKETPDRLESIKVVETRDGKNHWWSFSVPPHRSALLRRVSDGSVGMELENLRILQEYDNDEDGNPQRLEIGLTGVITFINGEPVIPEVKLVNPKLTVFKDNEWRRVEALVGFTGYVDTLYFDKDRVVELDMPVNYELHPYVWLEGMNHHPEHMGIWVPFTGWRMKDRYDLRLKNGEEHKYYYPNACAWSKFGDHDGPSRVEDDEVAFIRQVPDEECTEKYFFSGQERIKRNISMFGDSVPDVYRLPDGSIEFKVRHRRLFAERQIIADVSPNDFFNSTSHIASTGDFTLTEVMHVAFRVDEPLFKAAIRYLKGQLENKLYSGFSLVEDARHGYIGTLNGESFADKEVDWVIRQLIPIAQALPEKPTEKQPTFVDPFRSGKGISINEKPNKNGRIYPFPLQPKKPKNNKALKKAAKKERTRVLKEAKGGKA
jgi:hypothetical protein